MAYADLLKDPRWQKKRLEVMERAGFKGELCGNDKRELNIHHKRYRAGAKPWEYELPELLCICLDCHQKLHGITPEAAPAVEAEPERFHLSRPDFDVFVAAMYRGEINREIVLWLNKDDFEGEEALECFTILCKCLKAGESVVNLGWFPEVVQPDMLRALDIARILKPGDVDRANANVNNRRLCRMRNEIARKLSTASPEETRQLAHEIRELDRLRHAQRHT